MMEPQIQYAQTTDGISIAFFTMGEGKPYIQMPFIPVSNLQAELQHPDLRNWHERVAQKRMLIRYDCRGSGLSERNVENLTLDSYLLDVDAVAKRLGLESFDLFAGAGAGAAGIAYAARNPKRVRHLVLWTTHARLSESGITGSEMQALVKLIDSDWDMFTETIAHIFQGWSEGEAARLIADMIREGTTRERMRAFYDNLIDWNAEPLLSEVKAPTMVLHRRQYRFLDINAARQLVSAIPNARLMLMEGTALSFYIQDPDTTLSAIEEFLDETVAEPVLPVGQMIGETISHYKILEKLGEGGMGVVYKAEDTKLERPVALKFLSPLALGAEEDKIRFGREAKAAAALAHPSICHIYEIGEAGDQTFIAMEYIGGESLAEKIESGPLDINEALNTAIQIAEGLRRAHRRGIVHRDIKSANILIDEDGQAKILDFGIAKLAGQTRLTKTATIMGTVAYMSPEQAHGKSVIDHRTDIWSLGVVLYEILTGKKPFDAPSDAGLIHNIIYEEPEPLSSIRVDIPISLEHAVKKAIQKEPSERYADMEALISDLKAIRAGAAPEIVVEEKSIPSIAVLPFADMSPQKDQEYFCDGISESLINALTQLRDLKVIARTSAFSFKGQNLDVREIGKRLNVGTVLEGSIQKAGERVRVTAQLVNTTRGEHIWSEKYDRDMEDIFAIQDEITLAIVDKLRPKLLGQEDQKLGRRQTIALEAYNLYLQGRWFWNKLTEDSIKKALALFERAIEKTPNYATAYAGIADCYHALVTHHLMRPREAYPKAIDAAQKALEIDDSLAEAHVSMGSIKSAYEYDFQSAEEELRRAIELNPGYAFSHFAYGVNLRYMGRFDEAIREMQHALELDPLSLVTNRELGNTFLQAGKYDQAMNALQRTIEMDPRFPLAHLVLAAMHLIRSMYDEAMAELEKEKAISSGQDLVAEIMIGVMYAHLGRQEQAQKVLKDILQQSQQKYVPPSFVAWLNLALGQIDRCFEWLDKAYEDRDPDLRYLKIHPLMSSIHSDPRYHALLQKIGLEESDTSVEIIEQSPSIAVLPFVNMSADPEQEYFCDGISEELINALTQLKDLKVIARTSAFSFRGKEVDIRDIGKKLDVGNVLEGSVRKAGNRIRITAQLVDTESGHHLWSNRYDREMEDVFVIQDEITSAIVDTLEVKLLGREKDKLARRQTVNLEAYNLYLKGRHFWNQQSSAGIHRAIEYFEKALEKEPDCALALTGLADSYAHLPFADPLPPKDVYPKAREFALRALKIDNAMAEALVPLAYVETVHDWAWESAEKKYRKAIELSPGYAPAHHRYAYFLLYQCRMEESLAQIRTALDRDPLSIFINLTAAEVFFYAGDDDRAEEAVERLFELDPNNAAGRVQLGMLYFRKSMYERALHVLEELRNIPKDSTRDVAEAIKGCFYGLTGNKEETQNILDNMLRRREKAYVSGSLLAFLHFVLGQNDEGFEWLEKAYEDRDVSLCYLKTIRLSDLLNLHSDPRYVAILKKIGLDK